ncbi:hypothetical protein [Halapricum hydrolyticum]|uniref:Uncharacterized protein n=1 Tax=Halapricum hydrolyticum TaxID=2979991 RepID=A0AAE3LEN0_9EURY|nr:hypothetical protein [Halapricum hydrolyticum]MCU4717393.1 hypothetical protein [Halapricum hydrolyticum]MCU4726557.1 hypothetical protein [Halapricum hydrolyticum]
MASSDPRDRLVPVAIGLVVLFAPVLILALTIEVLVLTGDLVVEDLTLLTLLELYLIDLVAFAVLAYVIYRLALWLVAHRHLEPTDQSDSGDELWEPGFTGDTDDEQDDR